MSADRYNTIERLTPDTWVFLGFFATMFIIAHA
jgi:hypothetical protein